VKPQTVSDSLSGLATPDKKDVELSDEVLDRVVALLLEAEAAS
jgi:hypothetical protein